MSMGVYIRDMEMPDKCGHCRFANAFDCAVTGNFISTHSIRQPDCPLTDVPPHGRLGDLDALKKKALIRSERRGSLVNVTDMVISAYDIETTPTIIEAEE